MERDKTVKFASSHQHIHGNQHHHHHEHGGVNDYMQAVAEYRKTFASKQDVIDNTPDPAVKQLILHMEQIGCDTTFDRFDKQKPQCSFGWLVCAAKFVIWGRVKLHLKVPKEYAVPMLI